jgi:anti-anti-sigma regulatory factor
MYSQRTLHLDSGDRILLYTDGLYDVAEACNRPPHEVVADLLAHLSGDGWEQLHQILNMAAERRGSMPQQDDMTAVLLSAGRTTSSIDNGEPAQCAPQNACISDGTDVLIGTTPGSTMISVRGRGTWMHSAAFHSAWGQIQGHGGQVTIDLSLCEHLDSTFLGTLQEMCARADREKIALWIQGALPEVRRLFDELGMQRVISHFTPRMQQMPSNMKPLSSCSDDHLNRERMLLAHQALAGLSDSNRQQFGKLIEHLQAEIEKLSRQQEQEQEKQ